MSSDAPPAAAKDDVLDFFAHAPASKASNTLGQPAAPHVRQDSFDPFSGGAGTGSNDDLSDIMGAAQDGKQQPAKADELADLFGAVKSTKTPAPVKVSSPVTKAETPLTADASLFQDFAAAPAAKKHDASVKKDDTVDLLN